MTGIRKELLDLVALGGIGRAYARKPYRAGYQDPASMRSLSEDELDRITSMGKRVARKILAQVKKLHG